VDYGSDQYVQTPKLNKTLIQSNLFYATTPGMTTAAAESFGLRNALRAQPRLGKIVTSDFRLAERSRQWRWPDEGKPLANCCENEKNVRGVLCAAVFYDLP
jgi:hypothetical protein